MKKIFLLLVTIIPLSIIAQKTVTTPYFTFPCDCLEIENNTNNKSINYGYQSIDGNYLYMITLKKGPFPFEKSFLNAIKNSGTFHYIDIVFKGNKGIMADMKLNDQYSKHISFFNNNISYSIILSSDSKIKTDKLYNNFKIQFKIL